MSQPHGGAKGRGGGGWDRAGLGHLPYHPALRNSDAAASAPVVAKAPNRTRHATGSSATVSFSLLPVLSEALHGHVSSDVYPAAIPTDSRGRGRGGSDGVGLEPRTLRMGRAGTMNTIYRSVPPRPLSYTFSDVLKTSLEPRTPGRAKRCRSKTAPVSTNAPEEYAERFKARPTTRPAVIDFNGTSFKMYAARGGFRKPHSLGFPAVKTRNVAPVTPKPKTPTSSTTQYQPLTERGTTVTSSLHLAPLTKGSDSDAGLSLQARPYRLPPSLPLHTTAPKPSKTPELSRFHGVRSAASSKSRGKSSGSSRHRTAGVEPSQGKSAASSHRLTTAGTSDGQWPELSSSKLTTLDALTFSISPRGNGDQMCFPEALAHSDDYDDLSELPRPKRILPRRDLPWVFRFKVKKEMNALSKIMASKPASANSMTAAGPIA